ncbi:DUF4230 domain-containing protein [Anaerococcus sp.]|uniref:DUF4230 domain-containing protein n=1 Tax=Anaerococcus sp. TaxID=1872515 RepID=UPI00280B8CB0|nr:DUF4230 domain-containing protein [Anaerococcus sp.]MDU2598215.1 DUF4230 domain-containing protein [Anaerococcus sp.]MDU3177065.1 DUF4230 domain-containing protein [Anaerococcus sp.]
MSKNKNRFWQGLISAIIVAGLITAAFFYAKSIFDVKEETTITSETVESALKEAKELTTLKYHYKNIASFENSQQFQGLTIPFTKKSFLYTYEGEIHAGVDLDEAKVKVNENAKTINITLPETKILSHEIDEDSVMVYDEKNSIFNPLEMKDYSNFRKEEEAKVEKEVIDKGLLDEAEEQTVKAVKEILNINPVINKEYTINVK